MPRKHRDHANMQNVKQQMATRWRAGLRSTRACSGVNQHVVAEKPESHKVDEHSNNIYCLLLRIPDAWPPRVSPSGKLADGSALPQFTFPCNDNFVRLPRKPRKTV